MLSTRTIGAALLLAVSCGPPEPPEVVLWAWERPENLRFLDPSEAQVAVLVNRIVLDSDTLTPHPRTTPLQLEGFTEVLPVVRIEAHRPTLDDQQFEALLGSIRSVTRDSRFRGLQIDFDARVSERPFYRRLLQALHDRYEPLSMTALTSWCGSRSWLDGLPVDEIVPMMFRMGPGGKEWFEILQRRGRFPFEGCNNSLGLATDEPPPSVPSVQRIYLFHPLPWTERAFLDASDRWR